MSASPSPPGLNTTPPLATSQPPAIPATDLPSPSHLESNLPAVSSGLKKSRKDTQSTPSANPIIITPEEQQLTRGDPLALRDPPPVDPANGTKIKREIARKGCERLWLQKHTSGYRSAINNPGETGNGWWERTVMPEFLELFPCAPFEDEVQFKKVYYSI